MITAPVACVVDASVGIKLVITEPLSGKAHDLFAHLARDPAARFHLPDLFDIECANILWKHTQRFGYPLADAQRNLTGLAALALQRIPVTTLAAEALTIAASWGTSAYDASYVAAAHRLGIPLVTADTRLVARLAGFPYRALDLATLTIPPLPLESRGKSGIISPASDHYGCRGGRTTWRPIVWAASSGTCGGPCGHRARTIPTPTCWNATSGSGTKRRSSPWCYATARWCSGSAVASWATITTPRTPSRPPSSSSSAGRRRSTSGRASGPGCTVWPTGRPWRLGERWPGGVRRRRGPPRGWRRRPREATTCGRCLIGSWPHFPNATGRPSSCATWRARGARRPPENSAVRKGRSPAG